MNTVSSMTYIVRRHGETLRLTWRASRYEVHLPSRDEPLFMYRRWLGVLHHDAARELTCGRRTRVDLYAYESTTAGGIRQFNIIHSSQTAIGYVIEPAGVWLIVDDYGHPLLIGRRSPPSQQQRLEAV